MAWAYRQQWPGGARSCSRDNRATTPVGTRASRQPQRHLLLLVVPSLLLVLVVVWVFMAVVTGVRVRLVWCSCCPRARAPAATAGVGWRAASCLLLRVSVVLTGTGGHEGGGERVERGL